MKQNPKSLGDVIATGFKRKTWLWEEEEKQHPLSTRQRNAMKFAQSSILCLEACCVESLTLKPRSRFSQMDGVKVRLWFREEAER